jgi:hypothetical protein
VKIEVSRNNQKNSSTVKTTVTNQEEALNPIPVKLAAPISNPLLSEEAILIENVKVINETKGYRKISAEPTMTKVTKQENNLLQRNFRDNKDNIKIPESSSIM